MEDNKKLIEEAAKAILNAMGGIVPDELELMHEEAARAALAVFEKAQGEPSDAQVESFIREFYPLCPTATLVDWSGDFIDRVRAGLRAGGVRDEGDA